MFTVEQLFAFAVAGSVVSLLLEYFPKLNTWYNEKPDNAQRLIILGSSCCSGSVWLQLSRLLRRPTLGLLTVRCQRSFGFVLCIYHRISGNLSSFPEVVINR